MWNFAKENDNQSNIYIQLSKYEFCPIIICIPTYESILFFKKNLFIVKCTIDNHVMTLDKSQRFWHNTLDFNQANKSNINMKDMIEISKS